MRFARHPDFVSLRSVALAGAGQIRSRVGVLRLRRKFALRTFCFAQDDLAEKVVARTGFLFQSFGKLGSAFTSSICFVWRALCAEISRIHWYASIVPSIGCGPK